LFIIKQKIDNAIFTQSKHGYSIFVSMRKATLLIIIGVLFLLQFCTYQELKEGEVELILSPAQLLGKNIFFDSNLSSPIGQSCASCHSPNSGFSDPRKTAVSEGAIKGLFGIRNTPSAAYASFAPYFHFDSLKQTFVGGLFLDGRAATLSEQAAEPFLNHLEMNNGSKAELVAKIRVSKYKSLFLSVYGPEALDNVDQAFEYINEALEEYEETMDLSRFTSKFDYYLKDEIQLTEQEKRGLKLFNDSAKGNCAACHPSTPDALNGKVLFTDFTYDNLGVPFNVEIKKLHAHYTTDLGLGTVVKQGSENGKFKVPSLRNVALTAPYFHNGIYSTLEEVLHFYNERDLGKFGVPEVPQNVNKEELGNLKLNEQEIKDIVAFLQTLSDGYEVRK